MRGLDNAFPVTVLQCLEMAVNMNGRMRALEVAVASSP